MSISLIHKDQIDFNKWNEVVASSPDSVIYGLTWYLDAVADDWVGLVKGNYEAVLPLVVIRKKGVNIIYQPFFTRYFQVYGADVDSTTLAEFFNQIPSEYKLINFCLSYVEVGVKRFDNESFVYQQLNLNFNYTELFSFYSKNAKRLVKKAKKNGAIMRSSNKVELLIELFKNRKGDQLNFTDENYRHMIQLMEEGLNREVGQFYEVKIEDRLIAVAYFFVFENRVYYFNGSITDEGRKDGGLYFAIDYMIEKYSSKDYIFDFGGSKVKEVADFYKKFGAHDVAYICYSKNDLNWMLKKVKQIRDKIKK